MTKPYEALMGSYTDALGAIRRQFDLMGYGKLLLLAPLGGCLYWVWLKGFSAVAVVTGAVLFAVTLALWIHHIHIHERMDLYREAVAVCRQYLDRCNGTWKEFPIRGENFLEKDHPYGADLDIIGSDSLFQLICTANTWHGRKSLAEDLLSRRHTPDTVKLRQQAVAELAGNREALILFQCHTQKIGGDDKVLRLAESLQDPGREVPFGAWRILITLVPLLVTGLFAVSLALKSQAVILFSVVLLAAQAVFWVAGLPRIRRYLAPALDAPHVFRHYGKALEFLASTTPEATLLRDIRDSLTTGDLSAVKAMDELDNIVSAVHMQNSGLLYFFLNVFFLWDYQCALHLSRWKSRYGGLCAGWFESLGDYESLASLAVLPNVCSVSCLPTIEKEKRRITARALGHPLLPNDTRVCNNLAMEEDMLLISGSNMSGKTTFLRTVGINLALAYAGGFVCAEDMSCSLFHLMSSMRIADNLGEGISTFYAELVLVKNILSAARSRSDLFFLIDEIFRGTNSEDRLYGAGVVIRELAIRGCMGIVTTHDLSLCDLAGEWPNIHNHSFSESYRDDDMYFDYKMAPGKARTTNARFLMKKIGILDEFSQ